MPPPKPQTAPDFFPAETPDFIPAEAPPNGGGSTPKGKPGIVESALNATPLPGLYHAFADPETPEEKATGHEAYGNTLGRGIGRITTGLVGGAQKMARDLKQNAQDGNELKGMADLSSDLFSGAPKTMAKQVHQGDYRGAAGTGAGMAAMAGTVAIPEMIDALPSTSRAGAVFQDIAKQGANTPVPLTKTAPALQEFQKYVATGGKPAASLRKLGPFIEPGAPTLDFPTARSFYENVSKETARPGMVRRMIENPKNPQMRRMGGSVRSALNDDNVAAANTMNPPRGADLQGAMKEYAQAQKLKSIARKAALAGTGAAAGAAGLGKVHKAFTSMF